MFKSHLDELSYMVEMSSVEGLELTISITQSGVTTTLRDGRGQRGSRFVDPHNKNIVEEQARDVIFQEARTALKVNDR